MLSGAIAFLTFGVEAVIFCALFATYVAPFFAIAVLGPNKASHALQPSFRNAPNPRIPS
jgi:hypothetical protein